MADFYCEEILSGKTSVVKVLETDNVLAYYHTKPHWPVHVVVFPKKHIDSLLTVSSGDETLMTELMNAIKKVASKITEETGSCRVLTNLGKYQDSKHLHFHISSGKPIGK